MATGFENVKSLTNVDIPYEGFGVADHQPDEDGSQALVRGDLSCYDHVQDSGGLQSSLLRVSGTYLRELDANQVSSLSLQAGGCQLEAEHAGMVSTEGRRHPSLSHGDSKGVAEIEIPEIDALTASGRESEIEQVAMVEFSPAIAWHETEVGSSAAHGEPLSNFKLSTDT